MKRKQNTKLFKFLIEAFGYIGVALLFAGIWVDFIRAKLIWTGGFCIVIMVLLTVVSIRPESKK